MGQVAGTDEPVPAVLRIGPWVIEAQARRVTSPTGSSRLEPKAMGVLLQLAARPGEVVERQALLSAVWGAEMATDDVLSRAISELRRALGDDPRHPRLVETVRGSGYRLLVPDEHRPASDAAADTTSNATSNTTSNATSDAAALTSAGVGPAGRASAGAEDPEQGDRSATPAQSLRVTRLAWLGGGAVVGVAVMAVMLAPGQSRSDSRERPAVRVRPLTTQPGEESGPSLSPDGTRIAYAWLDDRQQGQHIYVKLLDAASEIRITSGTGQHQYPAWSPDGTRLAFVKSDSGRWGIYEAPSLGGAERLVTRVSGPLVLGLDWSADGRRLVYAAHDSAMSPFELRVLDRDLPAERRLTDGGGAAFGDVYPAFAPDGRTIAYVRFFTEAASDVYVVSVDGGAPRRLTFDDRPVGAVEFSTDGRSVLFAANRDGRTAVWRVPVEGGRVTKVVESAHGIIGLAAPRAGSALVVAEADRDLNLWSVATDGVSAPVRQIASTRVDALPRFSPDGARIAFVSDRTGQPEVWTSSARGEGLARVTEIGGVASVPAWSPDGDRIAFERRSAGGSALWVVNVERRTARPVRAALADAVAPSWSRDGRWIYVSSRRDGRWEISRVPADGGRPEQITTSGGLGPRETADGRALLFTKPSTPGLWRVDLGTRRETLVAPDVTAGDWTNWDVGAGGVYFVRRATGGQQDILFRPFGASASRTIARGVRVPVGTGGITLSPDGRSLVYAQIDRRDGDLSLVTERR